jgi:hypothetical protein
VVDEKKREDRKLTGRGVRNVAVELGVLATPPFVGIEVKINGGDCKCGGDARETDRNDSQRGPVAADGPPSRRKTACASPPGIDSNVISEALQAIISTSGSTGAPSTCSTPPATRTASIAGFNSENTMESSHQIACQPRCAFWTMTAIA